MESDKRKFLKYGYLSFFLLCFVFGCNKQSKQFSEEGFNKTLLKKNEQLRILGDYKSLVKLNQDYLVKAEKEHYKEGEALCYINIANMYSTIGNYKNGFQYIRKADDIIADNKHAPLSAKLYQEYGQLNKVIGLHDNALIYNGKALYFLKKSSAEDQKSYFLGRVYANRADFMYFKERPDSSLIYFHRALNIERSPLYLALIAKHHLQYTGRKDSADTYLKEALKKLNGTPEKTSERGMVYQTSGQYYDAINNPKEALNYYEKALSMYTATNRIYQIPFIYQSIAKIYDKLGETEKEHNFIIKYTKANDSLSLKQNEILNQSIEKMLTDKDKELKTDKNRTFFYVFGLVALSFIISMYIYKRNRNLLLKKYADKDDKEEPKNIMADGNVFEELVSLAKQNDSTFLTRFQEVYPKFIDNLLKIDPGLVSSELAFCAMIKLNFSSKEIANNTFIQHKSVQQKKHRLRKKLNVPTDQDLYVFFQDLD